MQQFNKMKRIIFVEGMDSQEIADEIQKILEETRVDFEINLINKAIVLHGNNDMVYAAKVALKEEGFKVS